MPSSHPPRRRRSGADTAAAPLSLLALAALALLGAPPPAFAQTAAAADPLNAKASVPPTTYRSAFASYRRSSEVPVGSWREANDSVARIGGWRVYAREAAQAEPPADAASAPRAKP